MLALPAAGLRLLLLGAFVLHHNILRAIMLKIQYEEYVMGGTRLQWPEASEHCMAQLRGVIDLFSRYPMCSGFK